MARNWMAIRVELEGGRGIECQPRPGRVLLVGPRHTFADLATAIDTAFGRWDLAHLHESHRSRSGGWGWIPDQYGRHTEDDDEEAEP